MESTRNHHAADSDQSRHDRDVRHRGGQWGCAADVIISEIMYNPDGADSLREWVEIYNNGATPVDVGGWTLEDLQDSQVATPIPLGTILDPGQALVLVADESIFEGQWGANINRVVLGNYPTLANSPSAYQRERGDSRFVGHRSQPGELRRRKWLAERQPGRIEHLRVAVGAVDNGQ